MPKGEDIHTCWSLHPQYDKKTGQKVSAGLYALGGGGGDGAIRELKKRCDAEIKHAGKPLIGCAMYTNQVASWANKALHYVDRIKGTEIQMDFAADKSFRTGFERSLLLTGEDEIVNIIEDTWKLYQKEGSIPDGVRMDVEEEIEAILEDEYCKVGLEPPDFSPTEIEQSKMIALTLGKRKRRAKPASPKPEETVEEIETETPEETVEETAPVPESMAQKIKREIRDKIAKK